MIVLGFATLAIVIGLIGALVFVVYKLGFLGRFWDALYPDFASFSIGRGTTQTFRLLVVAMLVFGIVLALWGAGAGVMRTAWLYAAGPDGVAQGLNLKGEACGAADCGNGGFLYLFSLLQVLRATGGILLICLTSGLVGALLGFVFGLPRPMTAPEAPPAAAGGPGTPPAMDRRQASRAWELSTNLTQISDWLTKIIVGVSLVEATNIWKEFQIISSQAAAALFDGRHGSPALIPAAMIGGAVFGFLFAYLYTELIIALLIAGTDRGLAEPTPPAKETLQKIQSFHEGLAPRISRSARLPEAPPSATREEVAAALQYNTIQYDDLISRPDVGRDDILNWSRAKALLNDYRAAAQGYTRLLGMSAMTDPKLLLEAARVFNAAGRDYRGAAEVVAELALQARGAAEPRVQQAIIGDAAALRLSGRMPGGYRAALELLTSIDDDQDGRLHLLRALANGQKYSQTPQDARGQLLATILADLKVAVDRDPALRHTLPQFWQPTPEGADPEDDLRTVYLDSPRSFEELINPPPVDSTGAAGGQTGATGPSAQIS